MVVKPRGDNLGSVRRRGESLEPALMHDKHVEVD